MADDRFVQRLDPTESYPRQQGLKPDEQVSGECERVRPTESYPRQQGLKHAITR